MVKESLDMIEFWVYGKPDCKYCEAAKLLLHTKGYEFAYLDVGKHPEWRDPNWKTVPQIFHNGVHIGGFMGLEMYIAALESK